MTTDTHPLTNLPLNGDGTIWKVLCLIPLNKFQNWGWSIAVWIRHPQRKHLPQGGTFALLDLTSGENRVEINLSLRPPPCVTSRVGLPLVAQLWLWRNIAIEAKVVRSP